MYIIVAKKINGDSSNNNEQQCRKMLEFIATYTYLHTVIHHTILTKFVLVVIMQK